MPVDAPNPYTRRVRRLVWLRQALAAVLLVAAGGVAIVYWARRRTAPPVEAPVLGLRVQQSAAGLTISKSEGNRPLFRVYAQRADKLRPGEADELHQVRIEVFNQDGTQADEISGQQFNYEEASGALHAQGLVHISLQGRLQIDARDLTYNVKQGTGEIRQGIRFALGSARGQAATATLDSHAGTAHFDGGITVDWQRPGREPLHLASRQAQLQRLQNAADAAAITLTGAAKLTTGPQSLDARQLEIFLRPDQSLRHLDARGEVVAASVEGARRLQAEAGEAHADFSAAGQKLEHLELAGGVRLTQTQPGAGRTLEAAQVTLAFTTAQVLAGIIARGAPGVNARLTESVPEAGELAAPELDFAFAPAAVAATALPPLTAIRGLGRTHLERSGMAADADQLTMALDPRQQPHLAVASGHVEVRQTVNGVVRSSRSQRLEIHFTANAQIAEAVAAGGVHLSQGTRQLEAEQLVYTPSDGRAVLTGGVSGSDPQVSFRAARATWISRPNGSARLEAAAGAQPLSFSLQPAKAPTSGAGIPGPMLQSGLPVVVTASTLEWEQPPGAPPSGAGGFRGTATFSGAVRLVQSPNLLCADQLTVNSAAGGAGELIAHGHVQTDFVSPAGALPGAAAASTPRPVSVSAAALQYSAAAQQAQYTGGVTLRSAGATLHAPQLTIFLAAVAGEAAKARLQRAVAAGGVTVTQPGRRAQAQQLNYDFAQGQVRMQGGPPSILDAEQGKITGDPLTFNLANDEIQVGGKLGTRVSGQTGGH